ncbi:MAG: FecR domain-containing protein [Candidatus Auribacterota bacterium]|nr:FecR domain-containing protein [Candidatus Auribacterota bacterium]
MKKILLIIVSIIISIPVSGLAEDEYLLVVRKGDTARTVTERHLVRPTAWERVVQYNYILKPGNLIRIPAELVDREGKAFLSSVFGDVKVKLANGSGWINAIEGLIISKGDLLRTGLDSGVVLRMGREDEVVLRSETEVVFEPYKGFITGRANRIMVNSGTILASTRKREDRVVRFEIRTPDSELELTGTMIRAKVNSAGRTQFEVLHGETVIKSGGRQVLVGGESGISIKE